jgi:Ser/Thr protein kinase RdoA (MazF antagonist)
MARLHLHARQWQTPVHFARRRWDWEGLFGDSAGFHLPAEQVWKLLPSGTYEPYLAIAERFRDLVDTLSLNEDQIGLIHADLHLDNALFVGNEARAIDFDDCAFAPWGYDFASALTDWYNTAEHPQYYAALLRGYETICPPPRAQLQHLDLFIVARIVALALWATDLAQVNARFRDHLDDWFSWVDRSIARYTSHHT